MYIYTYIYIYYMILYTYIYIYIYIYTYTNTYAHKKRMQDNRNKHDTTWFWKFWVSISGHGMNRSCSLSSLPQYNSTSKPQTPRPPQLQSILNPKIQTLPGVAFTEDRSDATRRKLFFDNPRSLCSSTATAPSDGLPQGREVLGSRQPAKICQ